MMWLWIGYGVATLAAGRAAFYFIRADEFMAPDDGTETFLLGALAMITGLFWPLLLPLALVMWHPRKTPAELRERVQARDDRIAELERELGMRP